MDQYVDGVGFCTAMGLCSQRFVFKQLFSLFRSGSAHGIDSAFFKVMMNRSIASSQFVFYDSDEFTLPLTSKGGPYMRRNSHAGRALSGGFKFDVFTDDEAYDIHLASLKVLEQTGVFVEDEEALALLGDCGALVDKKSKMVKIPPYMVEDAIRSAPSKIILAGRKPEKDYVLENNRVGFTNFGEGIKIYPYLFYGHPL